MVGAPHFIKLAILAFATCFQQDDCPIFKNVVAHVETDTFSFQMALQDVQAMLPHGVHFHVPPFESLVVQSYL
jgi:hypothetical protein